MGRITPQDIREQEFKQSALGYNRDQVNEFLGELAEELETLIQESNQINAENKEARLTLKTYMNVEESLKETLLLAQKTGRDTIQNAQNEAAIIVRKANTEKAALLFSAEQNLVRVQGEILKLQAKRDAMLLKLKSALRTNLELLDEAFSNNSSDDFQIQSPEMINEKIVDFSQPDLTINDLAAEDGSIDVAPEASEDFDEV